MSNVAERTFRVIWDECGCAITGLEIAKTTYSRNGRPALCDLRAEKMGTGVWWDTFYNRLCEALNIFLLQCCAIRWSVFGIYYDESYYLH